MKLLRRRTFYSIKKRLAHLYGHNRADELADRLYMLIGRYGLTPQGGERGTQEIPQWDEKDAVLITYGDMISAEGETPLETLRKFCDLRLSQAINAVHLLPFYPYSSDGGFSVIDYRKVDSNLGSWSDVHKMGQSYDLMYDLVLNHCSSESEWFSQYVNGVYPYSDYFIEENPEDARLSQVTRPRPWPLLTKTETSNGERHVWTTFSADQVDLNFRSPDVLFEFLDILLGYVASGARIVRLDAVAFLWKELGTSCIHLYETHEVIKLMREVLQTVAPQTILLTETNVPHEENISYFGEGDEAHMVYNFALPPLLLHALLRGDTQYLQKWAIGLPPLPKGCTFFNFTASHDGVGVRPLDGLVPDEELDWMIERVDERNGLVGYRAMPDGTKKPYELNITYRSALSDLDDPELGVRRFLCSQAVMLGLKGIPGIYFQSIVGAKNWEEGPKRDIGENRDINRMRWDWDDLNGKLDNKDVDQAWIHNIYVSMLRTRNENPSFHPEASQEIISTSGELFVFVRRSETRPRSVLCIHNFSRKEQKVPKEFIYNALGNSSQFRNLLSHKAISWSDSEELSIEPYNYMWIEPMVE